MPRSLLCRWFGRHGSLYGDGARCAAALRCNRCNGWPDPLAGALVERCRALVTAGDHPDDATCHGGPSRDDRP